MAVYSRDFEFMVGSPDGFHSRLWSVKVRDGEVYIMTDTGQWQRLHLHLSRETRAPGSYSLKINECAVLFNVVFPATELYDTALPPLPEETVWAPLTPDHQTVVVTFLKVRTDKPQLQLQLTSTLKTYFLHTVRIDEEHYLVVCYFYTDSLDQAIAGARRRFMQNLYAAAPTGQIGLYSGSATVEDIHHNSYYVDFRMD